MAGRVESPSPGRRLSRSADVPAAVDLFRRGTKIPPREVRLDETAIVADVRQATAIGVHFPARVRQKGWMAWIEMLVDRGCLVDESGGDDPDNEKTLDLEKLTLHHAVRTL